MTDFNGEGTGNAPPGPNNNRAEQTAGGNKKKKPGRKRRGIRRGKYSTGSSVGSSASKGDKPKIVAGEGPALNNQKAPAVASGEKSQKPNGNRQPHRQSQKSRPQPPRGSSHANGFQHLSFRDRPAYAALDLGTNNCRLLVAVPNGANFRVVDAFSRIVRLGEGIVSSGRLSDEAMGRAIDALKICSNKLQGRGIRRLRLIATEACRIAANGDVFLRRVLNETGLELEIVNRETEARLAVAGCSSLVDKDGEGVILFDIGGGSSELVWLDLKNHKFTQNRISNRIRSWASLPVGVVNISERHGGVDVTPEVFENMISEVTDLLDQFPEAEALSKMVQRGRVHMLGTSGTVTTLAGVYLGLARYDRQQVDGLWMSSGQVTAMTNQLLSMSFDERVKNPCIGQERADLVLAGCAILEALRRKWPCSRLRVADRGLREGILHELMTEDGVLQTSQRKRPHNQHRNQRQGARGYPRQGKQPS